MTNNENGTPITSATGDMSEQGGETQRSQAQVNQAQGSQAPVSQEQNNQVHAAQVQTGQTQAAQAQEGQAQGGQVQASQATGTTRPQNPYQVQYYAPQPSTQPGSGTQTSYGASPYGAPSGAQVPYATPAASTQASTSAAANMPGISGTSSAPGAAGTPTASAAPNTSGASGTPTASTTPSTPTTPTTPTSTTATPKKAPKKSGSLKNFAVSFVGAAMACVVMLGGYTLINGTGTTSTTTVIGASDNGTITADEDSTSLAVQVAEKALPSVVAIDVYTEQQSSSYGWGSSSSSLVETSLGSGVVLTEDGYIITNYHVIEDADALVVTIEGVEYSAEVVGYDESSDIAVIKADATGLTPIEIGDSDSLVTGEWVMTIGSPFGLEQSVATGIVSATSRSQILSSDDDGTTTIYTNLIQTDAAINPGNSGGALVDSDGKLIGINTLITSYSGNYSGVGFAIPVNYAISIAEQIINGETPTHAQLGVSMTTVNSTIAQRYGFSVDSGAYVSSVESGSGADEAGIQTGDIIVAFNGETISSADDLLIAVRSMSPGDTVEVTVNRNGEEIAFEVTLGSDESSTSSSTEEESGSSYGWGYGW